MRWRGPARPQCQRVGLRPAGFPAEPVPACGICEPVTRASDPPEGPVTQLFPRSGVSPGWSPFPVVNAFLRPSGDPAQGFAASILMIFLLSTCRPQNSHGYPRDRLFLHRVIHISVHRLCYLTETTPATQGRGGPAVRRSRV